MIIGGYDETIIEKMDTKKSGSDDVNPRKTKDGIFWMEINSNSYWQVYLYEVRVGDKAVNFGGTGHAVFNSGASVNYVPKGSYNTMMEIIMEDKTCILTPTGLWACEGC